MAQKKLSEGTVITTLTSSDRIVVLDENTDNALISPTNLATALGSSNAASLIDTHNSDTTAVHGIADTSALALTANVLAKAGGTMTGALVSALGVKLSSTAPTTAPATGTVEIYVASDRLMAWGYNQTAPVELYPGSGGMTSVTGADHTLTLADNGRMIDVNSASARVVTVPPNASVAFPIGSVVEVYRAGTGSVTIAAGSGVTVRNVAAIGAQYGLARLYKRDTNEWVQTPLGGATAAVTNYTYTVASPAAIGTASATSVTFPSFTAQAGDVLWVAQRNGGATIPTAIAGWTRVVSVGGGAIPGLALDFKVAAGGETSTGTGLTGSRSVAGVLRPTGGAATSANFVAAGTGSSSTGVLSSSLTATATSNAGDLTFFVINHAADIDSPALTNEFATGTALDFKRSPNNSGTNETMIVSIADVADGSAGSTTETHTTSATNARGMAILRAPT